jgi:Domain of unknown function (DUF1906)
MPLVALRLAWRGRYFTVAGGLILAAGLAGQAAQAAQTPQASQTSQAPQTPQAAQTPQAPQTRAAGGSAVKQVAFLGYKFQVPRSWPVIDLATHQRTCVRFDRTALYLGTPGRNENCPASGAGRPAGSVLVQPAAATAPARSIENPVDHLITATDARIRVTASYGTNLAVVRRILASASLPAPVARAPVPASRTLTPTAKAPSPAARALSPTSTSADTASTNDSGQGFDACTAPSSANMAAWKSDSPYAAIGIYIGGADRGCSQPNLTASWVSQQSAAGWAFIPIYVGPQAEYGQLTSPASQGTAAADDAASDAESLGIEPGATLYYDMEAYDTSDNSAVLSFLGAWTTELHKDQYRSGVYSSSDSGVSALAGSYSSPSYAAPDVIYDALWNGESNTGDSNIPAGDWAYHQRIHQYSGGVNQTYGGYTLNIDQDYLDVTQPYGKAQPAAAVDSAGTVRVFARASGRSLETTSLPSGGSWSGFTSLGGTWPADPAALAESNGGTQVFAVGLTSNLYVDTLAGSTWSGWIDLGGSYQGTPAAVQDQAGTVRVFVRGTDGPLYEVDQAADSNAWLTDDLGGTWANDPAALAESNGGTQVFAVGDTSNLYADTLSGTTWSGWGDLGGSNQGVPAAAQDHSGTVWVFARGAAGALWEASLPSGGTWSSLSSLGGSWRDNPAALVGGGGDLWVFATGVTTNMYYDLLTPGGTWSGWTNLDGTVTGTPAVVQDQSSTIRVYARGTGGNLEEFYSAWHSDSRGGSLY